jgi:hypothetical protein
MLLIKDMKNAPSHLFGEHKECSEIIVYYVMLLRITYTILSSNAIKP